jgi:serine/threonine protein kinase
MLLDNKYLLGRSLGNPGGFGITYLAWHTKLNTRVAIKEFLPRELAGRGTDSVTVHPYTANDSESFAFGLQQFLNEAATLARFNHPNVVRVKDFFEANGTGYLVMDYYEGMTLAEYQKQQGGRLPEKQALDIMMPILDGLREVHEEGFLHRDIKPQNIYLAKGKNGVSPILLDFGAARFAMGERSRSLSVVLTPGFAPFEQYHKKGNQGAWTDIYACAATLYHLVTGTVPPEATERVYEDHLSAVQTLVPDLSSPLSRAVLAGLAVKPEERPQSVRAFQDLLLSGEASSGEKLVAPRPAPPPEVMPESDFKSIPLRGRCGIGCRAFGVLALFSVLGGVYFLDQIVNIYRHIPRLKSTFFYPLSGPLRHYTQISLGIMAIILLIIATSDVKGKNMARLQRGVILFLGVFLLALLSVLVLSTALHTIWMFQKIYLPDVFNAFIITILAVGMFVWFMVIYFRHEAKDKFSVLRRLGKNLLLHSAVSILLSLVSFCILHYYGKYEGTVFIYVAIIIGIALFATALVLRMFGRRMGPKESHP